MTTAHEPVTFELVEGSPVAGMEDPGWHVAIDGGNGERWATTETYTSEADASRSRHDLKVALLRTLVVDGEAAIRLTRDELEAGIATLSGVLSQHPAPEDSSGGDA